MHTGKHLTFNTAPSESQEIIYLEGIPLHATFSTSREFLQLDHIPGSVHLHT